MTITPTTIARTVAKHMAETHPGVDAHLEAALIAPDSTRQRFSDPATAIALAALILAVVQFAYKIWQDAEKGQKPPARVLMQAVIIHLEDNGEVAVDQAVVGQIVVLALEELEERPK